MRPKWRLENGSERNPTSWCEVCHRTVEGFPVRVASRNWPSARSTPGRTMWLEVYSTVNWWGRCAWVLGILNTQFADWLTIDLRSKPVGRRVKLN